MFMMTFYFSRVTDLTYAKSASALSLLSGVDLRLISLPRNLHYNTLIRSHWH